MEVKILLTRMMCVKPEDRISMEDMYRDAWITEEDQDPLLEEDLLSFTHEDTNLIVRRCKRKLKLDFTKSEKVLNHIRSAEGWFGKTAGCFNILRKEFEQQKLTAGKQVDLPLPLLQPSRGSFNQSRKSKFPTPKSTQNNSRTTSTQNSSRAPSSQNNSRTSSTQNGS